MLLLKKTNKSFLKDTKGFSLVEIMFVTAIISIISTIAVANYIPIKRKAYDSVALSDAHNLVDSVVIAMLGQEDVDYTLADAGGPVGNLESDGITPRSPVFVLSPGVRATIGGSSNGGIGGTAIFTANVYHVNGTRVFFCFMEEATDTTILPF